MKLKLFTLALLTATAVCAEKIEITHVRHAGPFAIQQPVLIDSTDVNGKTYQASQLLNTPMPHLLQQAIEIELGTPQTDSSLQALHLYAFCLQNTRYATATLNVEGLNLYKVFVDGASCGNTLQLEPGTHDIWVQAIASGEENNDLKITIEDTNNLLSQASHHQRMYSIKDVLLGERCNGVSLSADGNYMATSYLTTFPGGKTTRKVVITDLATGRQITTADWIQWMPKGSSYYIERKGINGNQIVVIDPSNGKQQILAENLPEGYFTMAPTQDYLVVTRYEEGPKERPEIYQVLTPDDRQPGWRNRTQLSKFDLRTGILQPLTFGFHNVYCTDISQDGKYILVMKSEARLTKRPTTLNTLYLMDVNSLEMTPLIKKDGFINDAQFSPDGKKILLSGAPEALNGIGKRVRPDQIPNQYDKQLYLFDLTTRQATPLTADFNPSVGQVQWNMADGMIYFTAENLDFVSFYQLNPANGKIVPIQTPEDMVTSFALAKTSPLAVWYGQGASNSDRVYTLNLKKKKSTLTDDISARLLQNIILGDCQPWHFTNSKGDTIYGRYYLPPHFDASKKYPMIVNYYGGCSPTSRNFESRYPHHAYAALGYVVYVVEPSGATGFGQEFSARHVNTAGEGPAQDIIEGTLQFCKEHSFVNEKKIGCIGASYGGFMTQYLQTKTDIFAAAISHAGISDHTSYWGEGYWGYSYSEVSMSDSYPWTRKDLYVDRSPLFNAEKIHTPLLFVHGDADNNVPVGESIQMFTALKLLGRETAFVAVSNQDHHILEYNKRLMWQNTIWAWFAKWLQDDPTWWNTIYTPKDL